MTNPLLRRLVRTLLACLSLALALCSPARAEGETAPLRIPPQRSDRSGVAN
jgi:hypothetical protein